MVESISNSHTAVKWKSKQNLEYADLANQRALELFSLTLDCTSNYPKLKEIARAKELWVDFFVGDNQYGQTATQWKKYFMYFNYAARMKT